MSDRLSERELRTWEALHTVTEQLRRETGRALMTEAGLSQAEFTVLARLSIAAKGERSSLCAQAIGWDSSRLSHQLSRLERRGYVSRTTDDQADGRASVIALTPEGLTAYRSALGPHLRAAKQSFAEALTDTQLAALRDALEAIARHLDRGSVQNVGDAEREPQVQITSTLELSELDNA